MNNQYYIEKTRQYFTSLKDIRVELHEEIKRQLKEASQGDHAAKEFLARQLESYFDFLGEKPTESLYPNVPVYLSLIYNTFGQKALDAVLFQSPFIENIWIFENRPIIFEEHGQLKIYEYIPDSEEMDVLLNSLAHISGGTIHQKRTALAGNFEGQRLRLQMYTRPRTARTVIVRKHDDGFLTLDTMHMDEKVRALLKEIARSNASIIIAGGMNTGKTTLLRSMVVEKDPDTNTLTVIESVPELGIAQIWGKVVVEKQYVEEEPYEVSFGHAFRNATRSLAQGEARYPFEAHYVLESALRAPGFTFSTLHLKLVSPEQALRTFEGLVYQYRQSDRREIRLDIRDGIDFFVMLEKDYVSGKRYVSSIFCPEYEEEKDKLVAKHLVKFDEQKGTYVWTGNKIPTERHRQFLSSHQVNLDVLMGLGVW